MYNANFKKKTPESVLIGINFVWMLENKDVIPNQILPLRYFPAKKFVLDFSFISLKDFDEYQKGILVLKVISVSKFTVESERIVVYFYNDIGFYGKKNTIDEQNPMLFKYNQFTSDPLRLPFYVAKDVEFYKKMLTAVKKLKEENEEQNKIIENILELKKYISENNIKDAQAEKLWEQPRKMNPEIVAFFKKFKITIVI